MSVLASFPGLPTFQFFKLLTVVASLPGLGVGGTQESGNEAITGGDENWTAGERAWE